MKSAFTSLLAIAAIAFIAPTASPAADTTLVPTLTSATAKAPKYEAIPLNHSAAWNHRDTVLVTAGQPVLQTDHWAALDNPQPRIIHAFVSSVAGAPRAFEAMASPAALTGANYQSMAYGAHAPPGHPAGFVALAPTRSTCWEGLATGITIDAAGLILAS